MEGAFAPGRVTTAHTHMVVFMDTAATVAATATVVATADTVADMDTEAATAIDPESRLDSATSLARPSAGWSIGSRP